jgi:hypothetical protein
MTTRHYRATTLRTHRQAIIHLLEHEYKIIGSRKVLEMIADDLVRLQEEYTCELHRVPPGSIVWRGTMDDGHKPKAGRPTEDEPTVTAILPLITPEDLAEIARGCPPDQHAYHWAHQRDIQRIARVVKAGLANPGGRLLLAQTDLALLFNRTVGTIRQCLHDYTAQTGETLPTKGQVLDQGSSPTHKGVILRLYEQGMAPPDIARRTEHSLDAVDRYIKDYERVKVLLRKGLSVPEISQATGRGQRTVLQYTKIALELHPELAPAGQEGN